MASYAATNLVPRLSVHSAVNLVVAYIVLAYIRLSVHLAVSIVMACIVMAYIRLSVHSAVNLLLTEMCPEVAAASHGVLEHTTYDNAYYV